MLPDGDGSIELHLLQENVRQAGDDVGQGFELGQLLIVDLSLGGKHETGIAISFLAVQDALIQFWIEGSDIGFGQAAIEIFAVNAMDKFERVL